MQVQIKRQLKIELDQADITLAVKNFLAEAGHVISDADLAKINFVKSPQTGLRAELSINDEVVADEPAEVKPVVETSAVVQEVAVEAAKEHIAEVGLAVVETPAPVVEAETEEPGEVETSTVDDVALNHLDAQAEPAPVADEEDGEVPASERKSLFL